ncbi:MAG: hypothetical protein GY757_20930 [bacterium]|nr:hypothetical protein [bacterium]
MIVKKVFVFLIVLTLVSGLSLFSADNAAKKPVIKKGAVAATMQGVTRHWKDVEKISLDKLKEPRKMRPILNFENPRKIVKKSTALDPVTQTDFGTNGLKREALIADPIIDFAGMNLTSNGAGWPPDTNGDVGPTYFIQTVNTSIGIYNKSTGALVSATTFDSFFGGTGISGTPCDSDNNGDPIVLYDQYNQRWFILDFAWASSQNDGSYYSIAVSKTTDPTGAWWQYAFRADDTLMNDYPKCGIWHDGIYITANMFSFSSGSFQHTKIWALKAPDIYSGTMISQSVTDSSYEAFSIMPVNAKGTTAPSSTSPCYMYAMDADEYGSPSTDALYVWKYDVDWNNSSNTTWTFDDTLSTAAFTLSASGVPQDGSSISLDSIYGRLMNPAMYRKFAGYEAVYLCHVCDVSSRRAMRWYEIRISSGNSSIYQQGTYAPDSNHRWMGSVGADKNGSIAMGYSVSSSSMDPAIRYAGRLSSDPAGQLSQGEASIIEGTGSQTSYSRWGDYSSISIDPDDDETFWYTQEYYTSNGTNWQTRIGSFKVGAATPDTDPPVISSVASSGIDNSSATITWTTDESATSVVHYGLTASYGSTETVSGYVTGHSVGLSGLAADTTYHYKVVSEDSSSNSAESGDYTFTTTTTPSGPEMYVNSIAMKKRRNKAVATIYIKNTDGDNVSGATVYITWSGAASGSYTGVTNSKGRIRFTSSNGSGTFTVTVTNVTHSSYTYNTALNNETSDSI